MTADYQLIELNSPESIKKRIASGKLTLLAPLLFLPARGIMLILGQSFFALFYILQGDKAPWDSAGKWWTVWATLADIGCLAILFKLTRRENIRIYDLFTPHLRRVLLTGIIFFFIAAPFSAFGSFLGSYLVYGGWHVILPPGVLYARQLPLWGILYAIVLWPPVWSVTEELTYNGYIAPRLDTMFKHRWLTVTFIGFFWALQHSFLPLILDWKYIIWRFIVFVPCVLALNLIYLKTRKLQPIILAHYIMDVVAAATTISYTHK